MAKQLGSFTIDRDGENYLLRIESDDGQRLELSATYDQVDLIAEAIDARLDSDEEDALAVEASD